ILWVDVPAKGAHELDLDVPVGWVDGFVRDTSGARIADVGVWARAPLGPEGGGSAHAITDEAGNFVLELAPGTYDVDVGAEQGQAQPWGGARNLTVQAGQRWTGLQLWLPRDSASPELEVVLRGPRGESVEGGRVSV